MWCAQVETRVGDVVVRGEARVDDVGALAAELDSVAPDRVVCLVGRTHGAGCASIDWIDGKGATGDAERIARHRCNMRDNLFAPVALALHCAARNVHMTYMGTGCIFEYADDEPGAGFKEADAPNFHGSSYSNAKGYADQLMHMPPLADAVLNLRIRMPITGAAHARNFVTKIAAYERVVDVPNSVTVLDDLLPLMVDMAATGRVGTVNCTQTGVVSHREVLEAYARYLAPGFTWRTMTLDEQRPLLVADRSNNRLDASLIASAYPNLVLPAVNAVHRVLAREAYRRAHAAGDAAEMARLDAITPLPYRPT